MNTQTVETTATPKEKFNFMKWLRTLLGVALISEVEAASNAAFAAVQAEPEKYGLTTYNAVVAQVKAAPQDFGLLNVGTILTINDEFGSFARATDFIGTQLGAKGQEMKLLVERLNQVAEHAITEGERQTNAANSWRTALDA